jgi:hypothetical protein
VAEVAALVERFYLVRRQIAFFEGKQSVCHRVLFRRPRSRKTSANGAPVFD